MKKLSYLAIIIFSLVVFTQCEDDIKGTEDIDYVSFEGASVEVTVNKGSTADREIKIYTTQLSGSDRAFSISAVTGSTTADPASYNIPASVTVPASSNEGTFTVRISDINISAGGEKLVIRLSSEGNLFAGSDITVNMKRFCPLVINDFIGDYIISEQGYGDYPTIITLDPDVENRIWITNFWDWTDDLAYYDFDPETGVVTMPSQVITMGDGLDYTCFGIGSYNACNGTFHMEYQGDVAGTVHDFAPVN